MLVALVQQWQVSKEANRKKNVLLTRTMVTIKSVQLKIKFSLSCEWKKIKS